MAIDPSALAAIASEYVNVKGMTSIRGRRVQRLLLREFAGAELVQSVVLDDGQPAVLGLSSGGAALCATDGKGKHASVFKWSSGAAIAVEARFDLHKDSLPTSSSSELDPTALPADIRRTLGIQVSLPHRSPSELAPVRLAPGTDLRRALEGMVAKEEADSAFVVAGIGSLVEARLRYAGEPRRAGSRDHSRS